MSSIGEMGAREHSASNAIWMGHRMPILIGVVSVSGSGMSSPRATGKFGNPIRQPSESRACSHAPQAPEAHQKRGTESMAPEDRAATAEAEADEEGLVLLRRIHELEDEIALRTRHISFGYVRGRGFPKPGMNLPSKPRVEALDVSPEQAPHG